MNRMFACKMKSVSCAILSLAILGYVVQLMTTYDVLNRRIKYVFDSSLLAEIKDINTGVDYSDSENGTGSADPDLLPVITFAQGIGRLGNWLFQYASTYAIAQETKHRMILPVKHPLRKIFKHIKANAKTPRNLSLHHEIQSMIFSPQLLNYSMSEADLAVCCYLQSWRYFDDHKESIRKQFTFRDSITKKAQRILHFFKNESMEHISDITQEVSFVGVHIRRGDVNSKLARNQGFLPAPKSYIKRAMEYFKSHLRYVVFVMSSDDPGWCLKEFWNEIQRKEVFMSPGLRDYEDLCLLSHCNHSIMTVGSFGWWTAWLAGGDVVYYKDWPRVGSQVASHIKPEDYFPPYWIPLS